MVKRDPAHTRSSTRAVRQGLTVASWSGPGGSRWTGRHLVLLREGLGANSARALKKAAGLRVGLGSDCEGTQRPDRIAPGEGRLYRRLGAALVRVDPDQLAALRKQTGGDFLSIEPERFVNVSGPDVAARTQTSSEGPDTWGLQATRVTASRFSGRGIRVAILDTGLDRQHPDFAGRPIVSQSFVPGSADDDANGHGTYCAGVACGPSAPAQPPRYGVAGDAELYVGKVIGDDGRGTDGGIVAGIDWAVRAGCAVVSLAVGTPVAQGEPYSPLYEQVARRALAAGTLIMAAAGNDSVRPDQIAPVDHPANCPSILAIAAIDAYLRIAPFSSGGINADGGQIGVAAPGVGIRSSWPRPAQYRTNSGTSMATPYAVGIAALYAEANPSARGTDLLALLIRGVRALSLPARDVGAGLIQAP